MANQPKAKSIRAFVERLRPELDRMARADLPKSKRILARSARIGYQIGRDIWEGQLTLRAMSLVYTTLLSLIPLLAISFSVMKGFGVHREIEPLLIAFLAPLGDKAEEIALRIIEFIDNTRVSVLGYVGLAFLFYAVISLMQKIERAFDYVWRVTQHRSMGERVRDYLTLIIVGPTLMLTASGIWASILSTNIAGQLSDITPVGWLIDLATRALPVLLIILAFSFINALVPNTKVRWRPALIGGVVGGVMWNVGGVGFAVFVGNSANYPTIYSGFATAIFFMIWLYVAWMILLIGASISFYVQNPTVASRALSAIALSSRSRELLALAITEAIGKQFYVGLQPHTVSSLAAQLRVPASSVAGVVSALEKGGLLVPTAGEVAGYVPARSWDSVSVSELVDCVRSQGGDWDPSQEEETSMMNVWHRLERARSDSTKDVMLSELVGLGSE